MTTTIDNIITLAKLVTYNVVFDIALSLSQDITNQLNVIDSITIQSQRYMNGGVIWINWFPLCAITMLFSINLLFATITECKRNEKEIISRICREEMKRAFIEGIEKNWFLLCIHATACFVLFLINGHCILVNCVNKSNYIRKSYINNARE